jgi:hypothetical protein
MPVRPAGSNMRCDVVVIYGIVSKLSKLSRNVKYGNVHCRNVQDCTSSRDQGYPFGGSNTNSL